MEGKNEGWIEGKKEWMEEERTVYNKANMIRHVISYLESAILDYCCTMGKFCVHHIHGTEWQKKVLKIFSQSNVVRIFWGFGGPFGGICPNIS